jgi:Holliday junction resolvasome RuvABC endonuclease subunit
MIVLGADLGSAGACVALDENGTLGTWTWHFKDARVARQVALRGVLETVLCEVVPDLGFYERPFARGAAATRSLWGMAGVFESVIGSVAGILDATPSEIKKFATGDGKADKAAMIDAAARRGYHAETEHAADAYHAGLYALHHYTTGE